MGLPIPFLPGVRVQKVSPGREEPIFVLQVMLPESIAELFAETLHLASRIVDSDKVGTCLAAICMEVVQEWRLQAEHLDSVEGLPVEPEALTLYHLHRGG